MKATTILSSLAMAAVARAGTDQAMGIAIGGALDIPAKPAVSAAPADIPFVTISVVNMQTVAVSTSHTSNVGGPTPSPSALGPGTIAPSQTVEFAIPTGFSGNMALSNIGDASGLNYSCDSLIEFSFVIPDDGSTSAVADIDVSYVNGFTVPITCSCNGAVVTGCNTDLYSTGTACDMPFGGCCSNPLRADKTTTTAAPFFAPCAGDAYTFPNDNAANSFGQCVDVPITCCIGTGCPAHP